MATVKTQSYIVIRKNTLNHKIGDEVKLTNEKAKALVGKVQLKADTMVDKAKTDLVTKLTADIEKLTAENSELSKENEALKASIELLETTQKEKASK